MVYFLRCKLMCRPKSGADIVASPDQNNMDERKSGKSAENGTHGQIVSIRKGLLVDLDEEESKAHDSNSDPCEHPNDDECRVRHLDNESKLGSQNSEEDVELNVECLLKDMVIM
jgi:hypothetical protein